MFDENVVEDFLRAHPNFELMDPSQILERYHLGNVVQGKYFQLFPHIHNTDGFFAAVMKRIS
jgi:16S rRNA (cytosine967-C5)-methyltransferase